jgi:uncharacterized membrane protein YoaK (UPF0700 family)
MTWLAYLLAVIAGIVDVAGYIALGGVFTAHVSGDTVTAAVQAAHRNWIPALEYLAPVFLMIAGYMLGGAAIRLAILRGSRYWFSLGASIEAFFLAAFAVAHQRLAHGSLTYMPDNWTLVGLMACLTLAMGVQNALLSNVGGIGVRTTFVTGMIVNLANALLDWVFAAMRGSSTSEPCHKAGVYAAVWASFAIGGIVGGYLQVVHGAIIFLIPCFAMAVLAACAARFPATHLQPDV